jgi:hypothetical protein
MSQPREFRGTRRKHRSTKGRRKTPSERAELAKTCKHQRKRFRNRSTEAVCLDCGFVLKVKLGGPFGIEVEKDWSMSKEDDYPRPEPMDPEGRLWRYTIGVELPGEAMMKVVVEVEKSRVHNLLALKDYVILHVLEQPVAVGTRLRIYHFLWVYEASPLLPRPSWLLLER